MVKNEARYDIMRITTIEATTLGDAWYQCLYEILRVEKKGTGRKYKIDKGSYAGQYRLEFDFINIRVKFPEVRPLAPYVSSQLGIPPPTNEEYINEYLPYLMTSAKQAREDYTYGERLVNPKARFKEGKASNPETGQIIIVPEEIPLGVNQIETIIKQYREGGFGNNQCTMEIGMPSDVMLLDPPCLRLIDTKISEQDGGWKLHFAVYFRSWDLWGGLPSNLGGLQLLKEYMASEIGVKPGETIASSKSLHLYDDVWGIADQLTYGLHENE